MFANQNENYFFFLPMPTPWSIYFKQDILSAIYDNILIVLFCYD